MKINLSRRTIYVAIAFLACNTTVGAGERIDSPNPHPLAIHMQHWIAGTGQWRTPNPDYNPDAEPMTAGWVKEFGINWKWGPNEEHLVGELLSIPLNDPAVLSYTMYAFYNPATEKVLNFQVARNGNFTRAVDDVRTSPTPYGEPEVSDAIDFAVDGKMTILRHSNVFVNKHTQLSDVYEKNEEGAWVLKRQWRWTLQIDE